MKREFIINLIFLISINILIKPFYIFGIDRTVQNTVGPEIYGGWYASLLSFSYLLQIVNDFGIQYFNNKNIAQHSQLLKKYLPHVLVLKLILAGFYMAFTIVIGWLLGYDSLQFKILFFLGINQVFVSFIFYLRSNISGLHYYRTDSVFSAIDKVLMILFCSILLWVSPFAENFKIEYFVYAQTLSYGLTALLAFAWLLPKVEYQLKLRFNPAFLFLILKKSYPYALGVFLVSICTRVDQVMIERMLPDGAEQAGIYAAGYRLLDASNMIGFLMAGLLLPMFARLIKEQKSITELLVFGFKLMFVFTVTLSATCWFFQLPIMELLYDNATPYWGEILGYLMFSFIAVGTGYVLGPLLSANGSLKGLNRVVLVGAFLNIVLNWFLIGQYKASGAALATLGTQFLIAIGQLVLVWKIFELKINVGLILRLLAYSVFAFVVMYFAAQLTVVSWFVAVLLGGGACLVAAFALRLLDWRISQFSLNE